MTSIAFIDARSLKPALTGGGEIALLDVREAGEFAAGHPLFASSAPLSRFEVALTNLVPRKTCCLVLYDDGSSGRAERAASLAQQLAYKDIQVLSEGASGWLKAGYTLFEGVFVPSKVFGELAEGAFGVPHLTAHMLQEHIQSGAPVLIVDGRPFGEHVKMNIPGSICVPNGELAYRAEFFLPDREVPIVVHCAGRTRSILGAQILRDMGVANPVYALENGTQGWALAGLDLERGSSRTVEAAPAADSLRAMTLRARLLAEGWNVGLVQASTINAWRQDQDRTTYIFDVRSDSEFAAGHLDCAIHAPGGQLLQSTDLWIGVRGARIVLVDDNELRAVIVARWLKLMGWEAYALAGGRSVWRDIDATAPSVALPPPVRKLDFALTGQEVLLDTRPSLSYRAGHITGARWTLRSKLASSITNAGKEQQIVLCGADNVIVGLIAKDLKQMGFVNVSMLEGDPASWKEAGLPITATPHDPTDKESIDFVFFTHDRHSGNLEAARQYIAWETGLVARLDADERASFTL